MNFRYLALIFLLAQLASARDYSTTFPGTENPLSEAHNWTVASGNWGAVQKTPGLAFGVSQPQHYGDPTAVVAGTWGADQSVTARVKVTRSITAIAEVELRLRTTVTPTSITGYELLCSVYPNSGYGMQLVQWNGKYGSFSILADNLVHCASGDVLTAQITGTTFRAWKNGAPVTFNNGRNTTAVDLGSRAFKSGNPGIGFFGDQPFSDFGFSSFSATDGQGSGSPPVITLNPTSQAVIEGQTAMFSMAATGASTYQWKKNGSNIAGATSTSYITPATTVADSGSTFQGIATNSFGSTSTTTATLTVNSATVIGTFAPSFVQTVSATPVGYSASARATLPGTQIKGDTNVVVLGWSSAAGNVTSLVDSMGNTYQRKLGPVRNPQGGGVTLYIYVAQNVVAAAANTNVIVATFDQAVYYPDLKVSVYRGIQGNSVGVFSNQGVSNSTSAGPMAIAQSQALIVAGNNVWTGTTAAGNGWTKRTISPDGDIVQDRIISVPGMYTSSAPLDDSGAWIMGMIALQ